VNAEGFSPATGNAMLRGDGPSGDGTTDDCNGSHKFELCRIWQPGQSYDGHESVRDCKGGAATMKTAAPSATDLPSVLVQRR